MRVAIGGIIAIAGSLILAVGAQAQTFALYDAFTGVLDPARWNGIEDNTNSAVVSNTESQRVVVQPDPAVPNRFLQLKLNTGHPGTGIDAGVAGTGRERLRVVRDDILSGDPSVTGMRTKITVTGMKTPGCLTSVDPVPIANQTLARAQILGWFFNDGSSTGPGDATGDILAGLSVEKRSTDGRVLVAFLTRCTNANCSTSATQKSVVFTRKWALNTAVPIAVVWDRDGDQFVFTAGAEIQTLTYGDLALADAQPPQLLLYDLRVQNVVAHCSTPITAATTARFDFLQLATEAGVFP